MEINFGARIDKSMKKLIHSANMATKNTPYQRGKLMLGLDRIKNAPFEKISYVDKGDVTEELTRLSSHFVQFRDFLESDRAVGRNLDFLAQEIFREITTFGNKSPLPETAPLVVSFKSEMEKIREQIQNIE